MTHETTPEHIYEVIFIDIVNDKEIRISVHLTEEGATSAWLEHKYALWESVGIKGEEAEFNEDYSWFIHKTPIQS